MEPQGSVGKRWLFGPAVDLLLGCGFLYAAWFFLLSGAGNAAQALQPAFLVPLLLVLVSLPHYGATLLRVYETRAERRRYALFGLWSTLAVAGVFVASLSRPVLASLFVTLYFTWSPWHYSGQNYGLASMFLRRRGVSLSEAQRRWLRVSFWLSYGLMFVSFHEAGGSGVPRFQASLAGGVDNLTFRPIGIPAGAARTASALLLGAYLVSVAVCARELLRTHAPKALLPSAALVLTQALWFVVPVVMRSSGARTGLGAVDAHVGAPAWIALAHGAQYLWVTTWFARAAPGWRGPLRHYAKVLVAGVALWTLPSLLFSPDLFGPVASGAAVATLIAAAVNVHHFVLDGAIWKLRDLRIARVLLREVPSAPAAERERSWLRGAVWASAAGWVVLHTAGSLELTARTRWWPDDADGLRAAAARLRWLGLDDFDLHFRLGVADGSHGDYASARHEFERSLELDRSGRGYVGLAHAEFHAGRPEAARAALSHAVRAEPDDPDTWLRSSEVWSALGDLEQARTARARATALAAAAARAPFDLSRLSPGR